MLTGDMTLRLMDIVRDKYCLSTDAEISLEANPGTVDKDKFKAYKKSGINRLSIGCQSLDDKELAVLGRIHREEDFYRALDAARNAGFTNINVDLMSGLPGQKPADYEKSIRKLIGLKPEHISAYSLIIEEGTEFYNRYNDDLLLRDKGDIPKLLPDEEEERQMLYMGRDILRSAGYEQYEISNYALSGSECRHNAVYWQRGDYAGFGLGASSCVDECRWKNTDDIKEYILCDAAGLKRDEQKLSLEEQRSEAMFLGLRLIRGIDKKTFALRYGGDPYAFYGEWIDKMVNEGLMQDTDGKLKLSLKGQDVANYVWGGFV